MWICACNWERGRICLKMAVWKTLSLLSSLIYLEYKKPMQLVKHLLLLLVDI